MGAEFVSMIMIIVYVGAVAILFLFVVMMLNINFIKLKEGLNDYLGICLLIAVVLFVDFYLIYLDAIESPALDLIQPEWPSRISNKVPNTQQLGSILYTDFALPFQIAGIILLVAMVGSIVLTLRTRPNVKKQNIRMQLARKRSESVSLVDVEIGKGIK
jgi:NADH-quinone oxidoreductase subunit J